MNGNICRAVLFHEYYICISVMLLSFSKVLVDKIVGVERILTLEVLRNIFSGFEWKNIMMTSSNGNIFRVTGHLCEEFTGLRWIPRTKASDAELWC